MEGMSVGQTIALYVIALLVFLVIDLVWLGVIAKERYRKALKKFLVKTYDPKRAFTFYMVYIVGLLIMAVIPAINQDSLGVAMARGLGYGFFTYATYGLTNWAVVKDWPTRITFEDIAWGTFLGFMVATVSFNIYTAIFV